MGLINRNDVGILQGIHICTDWAAVANWVERLRKVGCNYFLAFQDVNGPALQFGYADWVPRYRGAGNAFHFNTAGTPLAYNPDYHFRLEDAVAKSRKRHLNNCVRKCKMCPHCEMGYRLDFGPHCCHPGNLTSSDKCSNVCPECDELIDEGFWQHKPSCVHYDESLASLFYAPIEREYDLGGES
jgi:hypothetical protein